MTLNREVFFKDPTTNVIPNQGVAKVGEPRKPEEWEVLKFELSSFVCQGEYQRGLERILSAYLQNLNNPEQPAVWVSGFYGSGKSHLVRVLEYLWREVEFPDGARARGLAKLPADLKALLVELSTAGKRAGGLWSAAGTLGAGAGNSIRLALLGILFQSANLPVQYSPARFVIWLKQNGYYDAVRSGVEKRDKEFGHELRNMYVSPVLAQSLLDAIPEFATSLAGVREILRTQFPLSEEIGDDEMLHVMEDVLELQSTTPGKLPCTLIVLDELQQFIGEDGGRALQVQNVVEACSARFDSKLLLVATGQAALQATPQLSKLQGRFTVRVALSDADIENVVREVVLRKAPDKTQELKAALNQVSGEIDRQLAGTKIGAIAADKDDLIADYPLLPVRRRFWERVLRAIDTGGTAGQLRTQLRIVHETTKEIAEKPLGCVVPADAIYFQEKADMLQSGVLLREIAQVIEELDDGTEDGKLRSRLCATIFLIGKLPTDGAAATGVRATAGALVDLLVEDLMAGSGALRKRVPELLNELVDKGALMLVDDEYRLQTRESAEWEVDYRGRYARIQADDSRLASDRSNEFKNAIASELKGISLVQGTSKTPRKYELHFGAEFPSTDSAAAPVWVRDEWSVSEKTVRQDAQMAGVDSPVVFVFLPRQDADALKSALARHAAAKETFDTRPIPTTPEGIEARNAMNSRLQIERGKLDKAIGAVIANAKVFQGGGNEVAPATFQSTVRVALEAALVRLFPKFSLVDHPNWGLVTTRAGQGAADALSVVGYTGDVDKHPACQEIRSFIGSAGKKGIEVRRRFMGAGYGWPQDAVDGCLMVLVAGGFVRAIRNGQNLTAKQLVQSQIGVTEFYSEGITVTAIQRIGVRKLIADMGLPCKNGEEADAIPRVLQTLADLADNAGGPPPLPEPPSTKTIVDLRALGGNAQFVAVFDKRDQLLNDFKTWGKLQELRNQRLPRWQVFQRLLKHSSNLPLFNQIQTQAEAIISNRSLLTDPDPVSPLTDKLASGLRQALQSARQQFIDVRDKEICALEASEEWQRLTEPQRQSIAASNNLGPTAELDIGADETLLAALDDTPLVEWSHKAEAFPTRAANARVQAAKLLEPKAMRIKPPSATLRTVPDVDSYMEEFRAEILEHIKNGPVIL